MVIVALHACFCPPNDPYTTRMHKHRGHKRLMWPFHVRSLEVTLLMQVLFTYMLMACRWMCKTLWDNSKGHLLPPHVVSLSVCMMWRRDMFADSAHIASSHSPCNYAAACWPPTSDSITWTVNIISVSSCPCDAQHLTGFSLVLWTAGWACVFVCRCVSVCQQRCLQDVGTCRVTVSSGGWITARCAIVKCCCIRQHAAVPVQEHWLR